MPRIIARCSFDIHVKIKYEVTMSVWIRNKSALFAIAKREIWIPEK